MRRANYHGSIGWTWELEDDAQTAYEFRITGSITPYRPMSMYGGADHLGWEAEGGEVEDITVTLESVADETSEHPASAEPRRAEIESDFEEQLASNESLRRQIEDRLREDANDRDEAAREDAYEHRRDDEA